MPVRPEEITAILKAQIEQFGAETSTVNVGSVIDAGDGIARVHGLSECMYSELVEFENGVTGLAMPCAAQMATRRKPPGCSGFIARQSTQNFDSSDWPAKRKPTAHANTRSILFADDYSATP